MYFLKLKKKYRVIIVFIKGYIEFNDKLLLSWVIKWVEIGCGWCWVIKWVEIGLGLCWIKWVKICKGLG